MTNRGRSFRDRLSQGHVCLGTGVSFSDPTVTEALCGDFDFVFIDLEHTPLSLEAAQAHIMATGGSSTTPLVRVPWNDAVWIKRVLDIGAAGVVIPLIRTPEEAREAVAACNYPPDGLRRVRAPTAVQLRSCRGARLLPRGQCRRRCHPPDRND